MKLNLQKSISALLLLFVFSFSYSQSEIFEIKTEVREKAKGVVAGTYGIIPTTAIIEVPNKSPKELYELSINWLNETYKNPEEVLKGKIEGEYVRWRGTSSHMECIDPLGLIPCQSVRWTIELRFKDGRVRWEFIDMESYSSPSKYTSGGWYSLSPSYRYLNKNGKALKQNTKNMKSFRDAANSLAGNYKEYLLQGGITNSSANDDW